MTLNVGSTQASSGGTSTSGGEGSKTWYDIEEMDGWQQCDRCAGVGGNGPTAEYWMRKNQSSPSQDGHSRQFFLGEGLDPDRIEAGYDHGVLTLAIPIAETAKARKIAVSTTHETLPA